VIVVDSSAIIAILRLEPEADAFLLAIVNADGIEMSTMSALEVSLVLAGANGEATVWAPFDELLERAGIVVVPFDQEQMRVAREAFLRYGKGRHPAGLNLGDCASYALAAARRAPLLFKGEDFSRTDLIAAVGAEAKH
jgi:ribonuclease VapC